jgi:hypothetical protein
MYYHPQLTLWEFSRAYNLILMILMELNWHTTWYNFKRTILKVFFNKYPYQKSCNKPGMVSDAYNPSYLGSWDEEEQSSRPYLKNSQHKKGLTEWLKW